MAVAQEGVVVDFENNCENIDDETAMEIYKVIDRNIQQRYGESYDFRNWNIVFAEINSESGICMVNVDVYVDMVLVANPMESDYVKGMLAAVESIENEDEKILAQEILQDNVDVLMVNYNQPQRTALTYQVRIPCNMLGKTETDDAEYFYRTEIVVGEVLLTEMPSEAQPPIPLSEEEGREYIQNSLVRVYNDSEVTYNRAAAVAYALEHATDEPYFTSTFYGSDCANFVSHCLHAGGIPIDEDNEWYPNPEDGALAGRNWMRTGFYEDENHIKWGVTKYMTDKDYFSDIENARPVLGSILSWKDTSHVAIVTYVDQTGVVKYSEHSNVKKDSAQYLYDPNVQNVKAYYPNI